MILKALPFQQVNFELSRVDLGLHSVKIENSAIEFIFHISLIYLFLSVKIKTPSPEPEPFRGQGVIKKEERNVYDGRSLCSVI